MIITKIEKLDAYKALNGDFERAVAFAATLFDKKPGRYDCDERVFAFVQEGVTKSWKESRFEAHRKYLDIQMVLEGEEEVIWQALDQLVTDSPFDEDGDVGFYTGEGNRIAMKAGDTYIAFPEDGHMPCVFTTDGAKQYKKIVVKVPVSC